MTELYKHPITPPPELVREWCLHSSEHETYEQFWWHIATQAAQWGADQELEACCEWLQDPDLNVDTCKLRATRRPKPPSLAKRALDILGAHGELSCAEHATLARALEVLDD